MTTRMKFRIYRKVINRGRDAQLREIVEPPEKRGYVVSGRCDPTFVARFTVKSAPAPCSVTHFHSFEH